MAGQERGRHRRCRVQRLRALRRLAMERRRTSPAQRHPAAQLLLPVPRIRLRLRAPPADRGRHGLAPPRRRRRANPGAVRRQQPAICHAGRRQQRRRPGPALPRRACRGKIRHHPGHARHAPAGKRRGRCHQLRLQSQSRRQRQRTNLHQGPGQTRPTAGKLRLPRPILLRQQRGSRTLRHPAHAVARSAQPATPRPLHRAHPARRHPLRYAARPAVP